MKKILSSLVIILLIACLIFPNNISLADENAVKVEIISETKELIPGEEITVTLKLSNVQNPVDTVIGTIDYDKEVFEGIIEDDLEPIGKWSYPSLNPEDNTFLIERNEEVSTQENIMNIKLKVKENIQVDSTTLKILDLDIAGLGENVPAQSNESIIGLTLSVAKQEYSFKLTEVSQTGEAITSSMSQYTVKMPDGTYKVMNGSNLILSGIKCPNVETTKDTFEIRQVINSKGESVIEKPITVNVTFTKNGKMMVKQVDATGENLVSATATTNQVNVQVKDGNNTSGESLYLKSDLYKIGEDKINEYVVGDKYIARIKPNTTLAEFIAKCNTNGEIKVIKHDGKTALGNDELVGTGMTLKVTKGSQEIIITTVVKCDLDGNGKISATDLSRLNQQIVGVTTLEGAYAKAADSDENSKITVTDLSTLNKMLVE